jgi:hypothetical protein
MQRIALSFLGTCLLASPAFAQNYLGRDDEVFTWSRKMAAGSTLTVHNISGPIDVKASSNDEVEIRAEKHNRGSRNGIRDVAFDISESGSGVRVCTVYRDDTGCDGGSYNNMRISVRYVISLPRNVRLRANTGNGEVSVEKAGADVDVNSGNGAVRIGQTEGRVTANTGNGDLEIESAKGPVEASSGNGRIHVSTASGPVTAHTGNGDIDVRIQSVSGDSDLEFHTGSGSIRVTLPNDFNGDIDASTGNGSLRSDFDIKLIGRLDPQHIRGTIGSGGRRIRLQTGNGRLELRRGSGTG